MARPKIARPKGCFFAFDGKLLLSDAIAAAANELNDERHDSSDATDPLKNFGLLICLLDVTIVRVDAMIAFLPEVNRVEQLMMNHQFAFVALAEEC